uniref:Anionic peptide n=1 Tax=Heterorhabditis bacteriophora TaxID=37862 RepID=A0A1I7XML9_HETBA
MQASVVVLLPLLLLLGLSWAIIVNPVYPLGSPRNNEPQYLQELPLDEDDFVLPMNEDDDNTHLQQNEASDK